MPGVVPVVDIDPDLAAVLQRTAAAAGTTPEVLAAGPVAQAYEVGLRHRVLVGR